MTITDLIRDQGIRTRSTTPPGRVRTYDLIVSPTLAAMPVKNREDGNTSGPARSTARRSTR